MSSKEEYLTVSQVAQELGISTKSVRNLIKRGELVAYRFIERDYKIERSDLVAFKESRRIPSSREAGKEVG